MKDDLTERVRWGTGAARSDEADRWRPVGGGRSLGAGRWEPMATVSNPFRPVYLLSAPVYFLILFPIVCGTSAAGDCGSPWLHLRVPSNPNREISTENGSEESVWNLTMSL